MRARRRRSRGTRRTCSRRSRPPRRRRARRNRGSERWRQLANRQRAAGSRISTNSHAASVAGIGSRANSPMPGLSIRKPSPMRTSRADVVVWRPRPKRDTSPTTPMPPSARKMLDFPTPELPTSSAWRAASASRRPSMPRPVFGCRMSDGDADLPVARRDPLGELFTGEVGLGQQQQRRDVVLHARTRSAGRPSRDAAAGRRARPRSRPCRRSRPSSWCARRACAGRARSRAGARASTTTRSSSMRLAATRSPGTGIA